MVDVFVVAETVVERVDIWKSSVEARCRFEASADTSYTVAVAGTVVSCNAAEPEAETELGTAAMMAAAVVSAAVIAEAAASMRNCYRPARSRAGMSCEAALEPAAVAGTRPTVVAAVACGAAAAVAVAAVAVVAAAAETAGSGHWYGFRPLTHECCRAASQGVCCGWSFHSDSAHVTVTKVLAHVGCDFEPEISPSPVRVGTGAPRKSQCRRW